MNHSLLVLALLVVPGCSGCDAPGGGSTDGSTDDSTDGSPDSAPGTLEIRPAEIRMPVGRAQYFVAEGATRFVVEDGPAAGTVGDDGRYDAPLTPGTYHVRAENDTARGVAIVHVEAMQLQVVTGRVGGPGGADGIGGDARFDRAYDVVSDGAGALYVGDIVARTIRKISVATGEVTTIAGMSYTQGASDGVGALARFDSPWSLAFDATNNRLFVADTGNATIRAIDLATSTVTTIAGTAGAKGTADGVGTAARFRTPAGLAYAAGTLYIADIGAHTVRALHVASGMVTTLCGTPDVSGADGTHLKSPQGVAVVGRYVYIADSYNHAVRSYDVQLGGAITTVAGMPGSAGMTDAVGTSARFNVPTDLAVGGTTLYVTDYQNARVRAIASDQTVTTVAGAGTFGSLDGAAATAQFLELEGIAVAGADLYIADGANHTVRRISGGSVSTLAGRPAQRGITDGTPAVALLGTTTGLAIAPTGTAYFADTQFHTIRKLEPGDVVTTIAGTPYSPGETGGIGASARFTNPRGVALDGIDTLYVVETSRQIRRIALANAAVDPPLAMLGGSSLGSVVARGALYSTTGTHVIERLDLATGTLAIAFGSGTRATVDGIGTAASFDFPAGIASDGNGKLFVSERTGRTIRQIDLDTGSVTTLAGMPGASGHTDGIGAAARFATPWGLTYDPAGELLYVTDQAPNHLIRRIYVPTGAVSTIAGHPAVGAVRPGPVATAALNDPAGLALASDGALLIASSTEPVLLRLKR